MTGILSEWSYDEYIEWMIMKIAKEYNDTKSFKMLNDV